MPRGRNLCELTSMALVGYDARSTVISWAVMTTRGAIGLHVEAAGLAVELHEVQGGQVAGGVVEEHVLRARVGGVDAVRVRAGVPVVDGRVELQAGIAADPRRLGHAPHEVAGLV